MIDKIFIENGYNETIKALGGKATLIAVSKYQSVEAIKFLSELGQKDFGENYLQELEAKYAVMPELNWNFIGAIQSRKIKNIVKCVTTIQSVSDIKHLYKINTHAESFEKVINIFLQVNIDDDPSKSGFGSDNSDQIKECVELGVILSHVNIIGLMCIPALLGSASHSFEKMKLMFSDLNAKLDSDCRVTELSMGMSSDYKDALIHGSTMVRVGSSIFGKRKI